jgi:hypothetical protein
MEQVCSMGIPVLKGLGHEIKFKYFYKKWIVLGSVAFLIQHFWQWDPDPDPRFDDKKLEKFAAEIKFIFF